MKINLNFENYTDFTCKDIKKTVRNILKEILNNKEVKQSYCLKNIDKKEIKELSIDFVFCDDEFIHKVNKEYRKKDKPTDVISFALFCDDPNSVFCEEINLGEIIISVDTAKAQAQKANHSTLDEIYYLISHGILHLLGFDHLTKEEYNFMVKVQNEVTGRIKNV